MKKRILSICLLTLLLISVCVPNAIASNESYDELINNFESAIYYVPNTQEETVLSEITVTPVISDELKTALTESDPQSAVSYNSTTGELQLVPYEYDENIDLTPIEPSNLVLNDENANMRITSDNRTQMKKVTSYPYCATVYIHTYYKNGQETSGSGAMVGSSTVLTAGHNVYDPTYGWASRVEVTPGGLESGYDTYTSYSFTSVTGWTEESNYEYDYAVIHLDDEPGVGNFGVKAESTTNLSDKRFYTYGYPGDKPKGTLWRTGGAFYTLIPNLNLRFSFHAYLTPGFSGGPVVEQDDTSYVVGILSGGSTNGDEHYGMAVRVTNIVLEFVKNYI